MAALKICKREPRISRCIIFALASGIIGSSSPDTMRVGCRSRGRNGRLDQANDAAS